MRFRAISPVENDKCGKVVPQKSLPGSDPHSFRVFSSTVTGFHIVGKNNTYFGDLRGSTGIWVFSDFSCFELKIMNKLLSGFAPEVDLGSNSHSPRHSAHVGASKPHVRYSHEDSIFESQKAPQTSTWSCLSAV